MNFAFCDESMVTISIDNNLQELKTLTHQLVEYLHSANINESIVGDIQLITEEIVSNIIKYAYPQKQKQKESIIVTIKIEHDRIVTTFEDDGKAFNPLINIDDSDLFLATKKETVGGWGIFLVKELADYIEYTREDSKNILVIEKNY